MCNMSKKPSDPWHYPRRELAEQYLATFDIGLISARGVFAKRRMGKTEFLKKDLLPAAEKRGYVSAYANLWDNKDNPAAALIEAIALAIEPQGIEKLWKGLNAPVKSIKASGKVAGVLEGGVEAELAEDEKLAVGALSTVMRHLDKSKKKLLLAIDEAQVLAASKHSNFAHALRAALDIRKESIRVIFAGSSENTLRRMFAKASEPFYNWAPLEPFDLLGADFVKAMVQKVNELSKFPLSEKDAMHAFTELNNTPDFFRRFLIRYLSYAQLGAKAALQATEDQVFNDEEFLNQWNGLLPADREVLRMIVEGVRDLHGIESRTRIAKVLGKGKPVPLHIPHQALKRMLDDAVLIRIGQGNYQIEDEALAQWLRIRQV